MRKISRFLSKLDQQQDIALFGLLVLVIVMMILPVPSLVMDTLIALNLALAILIMLVTLKAQRPLDFSTFPSILLISTLFRLAISISTTRLILKDGEAGDIIATFGEQVIAGNLVVGLVIFLIITVVQFLVITKGADRVAEVSARFTLDAMPGKQMSIDADVRAGNIDQEEARKRRKDVELESKLFGAMDGAMKFVKGDAIAGLVITAINLIGGIIIGNVQLGMSVSEAVEVYSLLTIGDGLVAQIPALLISIASGTLVTRVTKSETSDLGVDIGDQILGGPKIRQMAGVVLTGFGFVPGFPIVIFGLIGGGLFISGFLKKRTLRREEIESVETNSWETYFELQAKAEAELLKKTGERTSILLVVPHFLKEYDCFRFVTEIESVRQEISHRSGLDLGNWKVELSHNPASLDCQIWLRRTLIHQHTVEEKAVFVRLSKNQITHLGFQPVHVSSVGVWLHVDTIPALDDKSISYHDALDLIISHMSDAVKDNLVEFVTVQAISTLMDQVERSMPVVVEEVKSVCANNILAEVVRRLVDENVSIANFPLLLEALIEWAPKEENPVALSECVRAIMSKEISQQYSTNGFQNVILMAPSTETVLREGVRTTQTGSFLVLPPEVASAIAEQAQQFFLKPHRNREDPVLLTHMDIRRHLKQLLQHRGIKLPVLSFQEIPTTVTIYPVGFIK
ncbi:MAG: type III secretion system export apparatus subunit SctV [Halopseudomonas aestusnigri]